MGRVIISRNLQALIQPQILPHLKAVADDLAADFRSYARSAVGYGPGGRYGHYADQVDSGVTMRRGRARAWVVATKHTARFLEGGTVHMEARHPMERFGRSSGYRYRRGRSR